MSKKRPRLFSREFKLAAVQRILAGEPVRLLSEELKVLRKDLYAWRDLFRAGGAAALRPLGRPRKGEAGLSPATATRASVDISASEHDLARRRIAELERKIGQQQVELDFFQQALRRVKEARRPSAGSGVTRSTRSSKR
jgi:transposase-like protein